MKAYRIKFKNSIINTPEIAVTDDNASIRDLLNRIHDAKTYDVHEIRSVELIAGVNEVQTYPRQ